jgi:anthranilate phosphoribosyltransferase
VNIREAIDRIARGGDLSADEVAEVFGQVMAGDATPAQIGGLLIGMRCKGETAEEIAGAARAMRSHASPFHCDDPDTAVDTCGTGGDASGTANVSTLAALVAAGAGAKVAKHGNRALSSKSGSADVLEALGVKIDATVEVAERCLREVGITFLFAPAFHAATRHAAGPRKELGTRTIFNLLGPLTNPAGARNQIVGVFSESWCRPVATALGKLGARRAYVVHGEGGIDEIAVRGETTIASWEQSRGTVEVETVTPASFGVDEVDPAGLAGGDAQDNAEISRRMLAGEQGAVRNAAVMEAAVALVACGQAAELKEGAAKAAMAIDDGSATRTLERWVEVSNS